MVDDSTVCSETVRNMAAVVSGLRKAASKDLSKADKYIRLANAYRESADNKLEYAVEIAKVTAEYDSGTPIASELDIW